MSDGDIMIGDLSEKYDLVSKERELEGFIDKNPAAIEILNEMHPEILRHFPDSKPSLELCNELKWTTERKMLVNIHVSEETFFNCMLECLNDIYEKTEPLLEDVIFPVVLFPNLSNEKYDMFARYGTINLIAQTAYFNGEFDENFQREMTIREIPKERQIEEILRYCRSHENPNISDIVFDLQLDLFDVDDIIDELEEDGIALNVEY